MFKMLEKLINEHGSAKILKERLGLKDDQIASLKEEFHSLTDEIEKLKIENQELKSSLGESYIEIKQLKESSRTNESDSVSEAEANILQYLFKNDSYVVIEQIANIIGTDPTTAKYHVNNLIEKNLVHNALSMAGPTRYNINKNGIKYVIEKINT